MADGQEAGLAHFAKEYCKVSVLQMSGSRQLNFDFNGTRQKGPTISGRELYLRSVWDEAGQARFFYSLDGKTFQQFGQECSLSWGAYRGDRIGLFTVNDSGKGGHIDIDWFHYEVPRLDCHLR